MNHHSGPHDGCDTRHPHTHPTTQHGPTPDDETAEIAQCNHWLVGAKVGIPQMYDLRCAREPHGDGKHVCGSTDWNDSAGEFRG